MRALSIRQPLRHTQGTLYAELILRGIKTIEYRSRATSIVGERFYIYASKRSAFSVQHSALPKAWSSELAMPTGESPVPPWIVELANAMKLFGGIELPSGVIVGSAVIERCVATPRSMAVSAMSAEHGRDAHATLMYQWHLSDVQRLPRARKPRRHPQPVWFKPF